MTEESLLTRISKTAQIAITNFEECLSQTLIHEGGIEPRKATTFKGTVNAYVLDFQALKDASNSLSTISILSLSSSFLASLSSANINKIQNHKSQFDDTCVTARDGYGLVLEEN
jgi:hypothetical protein